MELKFRANELTALRALLGDCALLVDSRLPDQNDLYRVLRAAGYLVPVGELGPLVAYGLTPVGKEAIRRVLG